jgi:hypothetical protein
MGRMIGHNGGPSMAPGAAWRRHCWTQARETLLPHLPLEVLRVRLRRAAELGLDYRTYAGIRATTGRDVIAVLFSSNALDARAGAAPGAARRARLAAIAGAARTGLAVRPMSPPILRRLVPELDAAHPAPLHLSPFAESRARLRAALGPVPSDAAILVGDHVLEADWAAAARLAGYVPAARFFTG